LHVIGKPICDFLLVINSNPGSISHRLATVHTLQTNDRRTTHRAIDAYSIAVARQKLTTVLERWQLVSLFLNRAQSSWLVQSVALFELHVCRNPNKNRRTKKQNEVITSKRERQQPLSEDDVVDSACFWPQFDVDSQRYLHAGLFSEYLQRHLKHTGL